MTIFLDGKNKERHGTRVALLTLEFRRRRRWCCCCCHCCCWFIVCSCMSTLLYRSCLLWSDVIVVIMVFSLLIRLKQKRLFAQESTVVCCHYTNTLRCTMKMNKFTHTHTHTLSLSLSSLSIACKCWSTLYHLSSIRDKGLPHCHNFTTFGWWRSFGCTPRKKLEEVRRFQSKWSNLAHHSCTTVHVKINKHEEHLRGNN